MTKELIYCFHCATEGHEAEDCWVGKRIADRTTIHKRPWVGLTKKEIDSALSKYKSWYEFAAHLENILKEKNQ